MVSVKGYTRKDGTSVEGHSRSSPSKAKGSESKWGAEDEAAKLRAELAALKEAKT